LIPPLLALTYMLLGGVFPHVAEAALGQQRRWMALTANASPKRRALLAVLSTVGIIKASEILCTSAMPMVTSVGLLSVACLLQWAILDGAWSSLALALVLAIGGPVAELPFLSLGCWHYLQPDYFPLQVFNAALGPDSWAGLNYITGPCYFVSCYLPLTGNRQGFPDHATNIMLLEANVALACSLRACTGCNDRCDCPRSVVQCGRCA
jgi:hypothetical protein